MEVLIDNIKYPVLIDKKKSTKNTYIRVKDDLTIYVTTNYFTRDKDIVKLLNDNYDSIVKMIRKQEIKNSNNENFNYLGKNYDIIYTEYCDISFGENKVFLNKNIDIDKWYKKKAKTLFQEHLDLIYHRFSKKIPYPDLKIRKMTTRWGVCNTKLKTVTLNLELIKRDTKYLDYVIVHELSHLIHPNHSSGFWSLVEENCPNYKRIRKEMKEF
ncbi:MAG: M48 family metallopeptidase [Bacilli bacterium]|nr:M48 family metallopeptidase [Bacilli bacterium]